MNHNRKHMTAALSAHWAQTSQGEWFFLLCLRARMVSTIYLLGSSGWHLSHQDAEQEEMNHGCWGPTEVATLVVMHSCSLDWHSQITTWGIWTAAGSPDHICFPSTASVQVERFERFQQLILLLWCSSCLPGFNCTVYRSALPMLKSFTFRQNGKNG